MNVISSSLLLTFALVYTILPVALSTSNEGYSSPYRVESSATSTCHAANNDGHFISIHREVHGGGKIIDIGHQYHPDMPLWGSHAGMSEFLWLQHSMKNGSLSNNSEMKLSVHAGTHVDAPGHLFDHYDAGFDVDTLDLEILNGPALLVDVPRDKNITAEVMKSLKIPKGARRALFRTLNSDRQLMRKKEFDSSYSGFATDGAHWLVKNTAIQLVGIDYLSVAAFDETVPAHRVFLESREIILVEILKLDDVQPGIYTLHCLPLRLLGDGAVFGDIKGSRYAGIWLFNERIFVPGQEINMPAFFNALGLQDEMKFREGWYSPLDTPMIKSVKCLEYF